jgi:protein-S-isoprenylcysteine O-methyltransferase Ste14
VAERSQLLGRVRLFGVFVFIAMLLWIAAPTPQGVAAGAMVAAVGESIRMWAAGHLKKSVVLATSGPYAHTQNPLYLGRLLILTGLAIAAPSPYHLNLIALLVGYAVFFFYYMPRKLRVEGGRLERIHGLAYARYRQSVPLLFPSPRRFPEGTERWSFAQMIRNQEPLVALGLVLAFLFLGVRSGAL